MSSTMAGTRKPATGRSRSTAAIQRIGIEAGEEPSAQTTAQGTADEERAAGGGERRAGDEARAPAS